ncbi:hypothetical protein FQN55_002195 [Onygenales sp. PD_40]|nr:hypothetical protein FQN55_002195 [Onygenales sp. PD_40]
MNTLMEDRYLESAGGKTDLFLMRSVSLISQIFIAYWVIEKEEPQGAAFRKKVPNNLVWDSSSYDDIHAGVTVSNGGDNQENKLLTTSGILMEDLEGNCFFTVTSHSFPRNCLGVYHPNKNGKVIGSVDHEIKDSDIALAKLTPGMQYKNETFAANGDDEIIHPFRIRGIRDGMDVHITRA